jgi:hypothetical protein
VSAERRPDIPAGNLEPGTLARFLVDDFTTAWNAMAQASPDPRIGDNFMFARQAFAYLEWAGLVPTGCISSSESSASNSSVAGRQAPSPVAATLRTAGLRPYQRRAIVHASWSSGSSCPRRIIVATLSARSMINSAVDSTRARSSRSVGVPQRHDDGGASYPSNDRRGDVDGIAHVSSPDRMDAESQARHQRDALAIRICASEIRRADETPGVGCRA